MADFVAVIRRTVDGLSDNVPEMRSKVYEKARGAVRRQLENMKPRPSDEMIERQMVKLEAAISEVESDYAEALPPIDEAVADDATYQEPIPAEYEAPVDHEPVAPEPIAQEPAAQEPESAESEPEPVHDAQPEPVAEPQPEPLPGPEALPEQEIYHEPETAEQPEPVAAIEDVPAERFDVHEASAGVQHEPAHDVEQASEEAPAWQDEANPVEPVSQEPDTGWQEPVEPVQAVEPAYVDDHQPAEEHPQPAEETVLQDGSSPEASVEAETPVSAPLEEHEPVEQAPTLDAPEQWHDPAAFEPVEVETPAQEPLRANVEIPAAGSEWDLPEWEQQAAPVAASATVEPVWNETVTGDNQGTVIDLAEYMPPEPVADDKADGATEPSHSWDWDDRDPFQQQTTAPAQPEGSEPAISDWSWPVEKPAVPETAASLPAAHWDDIDRLLDTNEPAAESAAAAPAAVPDPEALAAPARPVSYRVEPKKSSSLVKTAGVAAVVLLALGGSGYAYWMNRDAVNTWVSETIASVTASAPVQTTTETPQTTEPATDAPEANSQTPAEPQTDVASADSATTKFTQRLQADGTESDAGPAPLPTGDATSEAEGKSVAAQTEAGTAVAQAGATGADPAATQTPATATTPATPQAEVQIPEGAQKMFLYEERLGQSSPTAVEGTVAWSTKEESPGNDAPPEPTIQAQISVPERGLTALMTIKRNTDPSLPASHVVEFVFSLPENFEGGAIESVQRVSMKQNEQARGDALIAVPAKITDDFHMIALNDYPEAVATNTDLLRNRSWIDVPLTYRNGRRALLTLEKGPAGTEAFTKALQAWSRAPAVSGQ